MKGQSLLFVDSLPRWPQWLGLGQVKARSQKLHLDLAQGRQGSKHLGHPPETLDEGAELHLLHYAVRVAGSGPEVNSTRHPNGMLGGRPSSWAPSRTSERPPFMQDNWREAAGAFIWHDSLPPSPSLIHCVSSGREQGAHQPPNPQQGAELQWTPGKVTTVGTQWAEIDYQQKGSKLLLCLNVPEMERQSQKRSTALQPVSSWTICTLSKYELPPTPSKARILGNLSYWLPSNPWWT